MPASGYKIPVSVLVVIYTAAHDDLQVLLLERADAPGFWQSVTGSLDAGETPAQTAVREVREETGLNANEAGVLTDWQQQNRYEIFERWRHRYAPGVTHNTEHVFGLQLTPAHQRARRKPALPTITIAPREHTQYLWLPYQEAAAKVFSPSNAQAIRDLPKRVIK